MKTERDEPELIKKLRAQAEFDEVNFMKKNGLDNIREDFERQMPMLEKAEKTKYGIPDRSDRPDKGTNWPYGTYGGVAYKEARHFLLLRIKPGGYYLGDALRTLFWTAIHDIKHLFRKRK